MPTALLWVVAFALTFAENAVGAQETRAIAKLRARQAANWSLIFEVILWVDLLLLVNAGWTLIIPIGAGSYLGTYWSVERKKRRMQEKRNERQRREATGADPG